MEEAESVLQGRDLVLAEQVSPPPDVMAMLLADKRSENTKRAYEYDREIASQSGDSLDQLIEMVALNSSVKEITLLCHSMGCLLTLDALRSRSIVGGLGLRRQPCLPDTG